MKTRLLLVALIVSVGLNLGGLVTLGYHRWEKSSGLRRVHDRRTAFPGPWKHRLDLTEEQMEAMGRLHEQMFDRMSPVRESLVAKRRALLELLRDQDSDGARLDSLVTEIAALQAELEMSLLHNIQKIMETMTVEQRTEFLKRFEKRLLKEDRHPFPSRRRF